MLRTPAIAMMVHITMPSMTGPVWSKGFIGFGCSIAAVYAHNMNQSKLGVMNILLVIALLAGSISAQTVNEPSRYNWQFYESSATYWAGSGIAYHSSFDRQELNPLFQDKHGRVHGGRYWGTKVGLYAVTVLLQKKWPNRMNWLRRVSGYIDIGFSAYNYSVR